MSLFSVVCLFVCCCSGGGGGGGGEEFFVFFGLKIGALEIAVISIDNSKTGLFKSIIVRALASLFFSFFFFFPQQYQIINDVRSYSLLIVYVVFCFLSLFSLPSTPLWGHFFKNMPPSIAIYLSLSLHIIAVLHSTDKNRTTEAEQKPTADTP